MSKPLVCLLIDDDLDEPEIFRNALRRMEIKTECVSVSTGREAITLLNGLKVNPDIIFLDMNMSPMDGQQCLEEIRKLKVAENIPVIIYSTAPIITQREQMLQTGATGFIRKCSSVADLQKSLTECFSNVQ